MKTAYRLILPLALCALGATACKKDDQPKAAAGGELLPRSVSDDMLPYDTVRSQPSLSDPDGGLGIPEVGGPRVSATAVVEDEDDSGPVEEAPPVIDIPPPPAQ
ncbi:MULTISPECIES: hypothetical protein [Novosphingobium]|jgi:hypothetical protein|uniref:Lipoprotein n=1 Tax=Novosphingobium panipatense TaxID=428991 RepID=A0ABY1QJJ8_9SPHN|nr:MULTISPECIES: hypothetical protein [Novosphingobium]SMP70179.1 hypothetical protein SAMN06296065_105266 [Novosphingobium panipatense]